VDDDNSDNDAAAGDVDDAYEGDDDDAVAYRESYPDTIMTRVKSVPLLPCWTWTVFLLFLCFGVEPLFV
jgi:hypothetical protein